jgi:hypothetical protein
VKDLPIPYEKLEQIATSGSPLLLRSIGRLYGLGEAEQNALARGRIPGWSLLLVGIGGGFVAGALAYRTWPGALGKVLGKGK